MTAFPPLLGQQPHTMLLGSMPGKVSLKQNQYYAHPRNTFWWLMGQIIGFDYSLPYAERVSKVTEAGFVVWDVLQDCQREGSLDSNIQRDSEECNDFQTFLTKANSIRLIAFNGAASQRIFMRHCGPVLNQLPNITTTLLPSSSPAHASMTKLEKLKKWRTQLIECENS